VAEHRDDCSAKGLCTCDYEPLIRADERNSIAIATDRVRRTAAEGAMADLRAKISTLPSLQMRRPDDVYDAYILRAKVIALFDGSQ
jgi:hypothetical protein